MINEKQSNMTIEEFKKEVLSGVDMDPYFSADKMTHEVIFDEVHNYFPGQWVRVYWDDQKNWWVCELGGHGWERKAAVKVRKIPVTMADHKQEFATEKKRVLAEDVDLDGVNKFGEVQFGLACDKDGLIDGSKDWGWPRRKDINELIKMAEEMKLEKYEIFVEANIYWWETWQDYFDPSIDGEPTDFFAYHTIYKKG